MDFEHLHGMLELGIQRTMQRSTSSKVYDRIIEKSRIIINYKCKVDIEMNVQYIQSGKGYHYFPKHCKGTTHMA